MSLQSAIFALTGGSEGGSNGAMTSLFSIGMMIAIVAVMYFLMIRPQRKQEKEIAAMRNNLEVGDEITTIGGIIGRVISIKEETILIETSKDKTKIRLLKSAVKTVDVKAADAQK